MNFTAHFNNYVCPNDSIRRNITDSVAVVARVEYDQDTHIDDFDCYEEKDVQRWNGDEWWFGGVVLSIEVDGRTVRDHVASLWGLDVNFGEDNSYLDEVANELLDESKDEIRSILESIASEAGNAAVLVS